LIGFQGANASNTKYMDHVYLDPAFVVEYRLGQQLLESGVFRFQFPQVLGVRHVHTTELATPTVEGGVTETELVAQLRDRRCRFQLVSGNQ
jgi:hypothetical protein